MDETKVPSDIERQDLTDDQADFLIRNFGREASDLGLVATFTTRKQENGRTTLVIHFQREPPAAGAETPPAAVAAVPELPAELALAPLPAAAAKTSIAWGAKVSAEFRTKVRAIASELDTDPNFLMAAMAFETGRDFSPSVRNRLSGAVGLIQFMPRTAKGLGTSSEALAQMTAENQLDFVSKYFAGQKGRLHSLSDLYMAILWPAAVGKPEGFVLFAKDDNNPAAFNQNMGLDLDRDGQVTKAEAASRVRTLLVEGQKPGNIG